MYYFHLQNRVTERFLTVYPGYPYLAETNMSAGCKDWTRIDVPGTKFFRIKSNSLGTYLAVGEGKVLLANTEADWISAHWYLEKVEGTKYVRIRHRTTALLIGRLHRYTEKFKTT